MSIEQTTVEENSSKNRRQQFLLTHVNKFDFGHIRDYGILGSLCGKVKTSSWPLFAPTKQLTKQKRDKTRSTLNRRQSRVLLVGSNSSQSQITFRNQLKSLKSTKVSEHDKVSQLNQSHCI